MVTVVLGISCRYLTRVVIKMIQYRSINKGSPIEHDVLLIALAKG